MMKVLHFTSLRRLARLHACKTHTNNRWHCYMSEPLFIYARLLDESGTPINVSTIPSVYSIAQQASACFPWGGFGRYARVVGHVPNGFTYWPGVENHYKVEIKPTDTRAEQWLKQSMSLPACSIVRVDIQLDNSNRVDIQLGDSSLGDLPDIVAAHDVRCISSSPEPVSIC